MIAAVVAIVVAPGQQAMQLRTSTGGAWLVTPRAAVTLLDGATAQASGFTRPAPVIAQVKTGDADSEVSQVGSDAFVADRQLGRILRVDGATLAITTRSGFLRGVSVYAAAHVVYATAPDRDMIAALDPQTLSNRFSVAATAEDAMVDRAGTLWFVDANDYRLCALRGDRLSRYATVPDPGESQFVAVNGGPVLVDTAARQARPVSPSGSFSAPVELGADATVLPRRTSTASAPLAGSPDANLVYAVLSPIDTLLITDLANGSSVPIPLDISGHELGAPIESGGVVYIPDVTAQRLILVDLTEHRLIGSSPMPGLTRHFRFQTQSDGLLYYADPDSAQAGVISPGGTLDRTKAYALLHPPVAPMSATTAMSHSASRTSHPSKSVNSLPHSLGGARFPTTPTIGSPTSSSTSRPVVRHSPLLVANSTSFVVIGCKTSTVQFWLRGDLTGITGYVMWTSSDGFSRTANKAARVSFQPQLDHGNRFTVTATISTITGVRVLTSAPVTLAAATCLPPLEMVQVDVTGNGVVDVVHGATTTRCASKGCSVPGVREGDTLTFRPYAGSVIWYLASSVPENCGSKCSTTVTADYLASFDFEQYEQITAKTDTPPQAPGDVTFTISGAEKKSTCGTNCWQIEWGDDWKVSVTVNDEAGTQLFLGWENCPGREEYTAAGGVCYLGSVPGNYDLIASLGED